jgi:hypothetical protein
MLKPGTRTGVIAAMVALFIVSIFAGDILTREHQDYEKTPDTKTPLQALGPALLGMRQVAASLLWVKTDDYFHEGQYEPILRMVRLITTIDPHQVDVYTTGAWHMAYNFMDKRLIRAGLEFLQEGVENNPSIYDLYFESGWTNMDKMKDYPKASYWYQIASTKGTSDGRPLPPAFTWHQLAISYERAGDIDDAIAQWQKTLERETKELAEKPKDFSRKSNHDVSVHNLMLTKWRLEHRRHLGDQPLDAGLDFTVKRVAQRKLRIEGNINVLDLSRVNVVFRDKNWETMDGRGPEDPIRPIDRTAQLDPMRMTDEVRMNRLTLEWNDVSVNGGHFKWDLNLNKDPADMDRDPRTIYPLTSDEYEVTVTFDPRTQAPFIQDVYGWSGEGVTDPKFLKLDWTRAGTMDGKKVPLRVIQKTITLKRSEVL